MKLVTGTNEDAAMEETALVPDSSSEAWLTDTSETETVTWPAEIKAKTRHSSQ